MTSRCENRSSVVSLQFSRWQRASCHLRGVWFERYTPRVPRSPLSFVRFTETDGMLFLDTPPPFPWVARSPGGALAEFDPTTHWIVFTQHCKMWCAPSGTLAFFRPRLTASPPPLPPWELGGAGAHPGRLSTSQRSNWERSLKMIGEGRARLFSNDAPSGTLAPWCPVAPA